MATYRASCGGFNPLSVGLMVLGFMVFWPVGLAILAYNIWGHRMGCDFHSMKRRIRESQFFRDAPFNRSPFNAGPFQTGNVAFDDYRQRELDRLEAERRKLDEMRDEFDQFLRNLRRAKDQEEFDRFMSGRHNSQPQA